MKFESSFVLLECSLASLVVMLAVVRRAAWSVGRSAKPVKATQVKTTQPRKLSQLVRPRMSTIVSMTMERIAHAHSKNEQFRGFTQRL